MNYSDLQTQVASYLHRTDLTTQIQTFIALAESYLFRELSVKELQISADGMTTGGYGTLPSDFGSVSRVTITYGGNVRTLDYVSVPVVSTSTGGGPSYYTLEKDQLRIFGASDGQTYTLYYIPALVPLSDSASTNWLLDNAFDLYLDASCKYGAKHIRDYAEVDRLDASIAAGLSSVQRFAERRGQPATGSLQIKTRRSWWS